MTSAPIDVGSRPQLFLDDHVVESAVHVRRQLHRPTRHQGNPVLRADMPWEQGGNGVYLYGGTVMFDDDDGVFKMWYRTASVDVDLSGGKPSEVRGAYKACYAVSDDGLRWERQALGLVEYGGSTDNNMLPPAQGTRAHIRRPNLIKDYADPDPQRRYKIAYMDNFDGRWGLAKGYSPDGIHWTMNVGEPSFFARPVAPNGILFGWDPRMRKFAHYHRKSDSVRADVDGADYPQPLGDRQIDQRGLRTLGRYTGGYLQERGGPPGWSPAHGVDLAAVLYTEDLYVGFVDTCSTHWVEDDSRGGLGGLPKRVRGLQDRAPGQPGRRRLDAGRAALGVHAPRPVGHVGQQPRRALQAHRPGRRDSHLLHGEQSARRRRPRAPSPARPGPQHGERRAPGLRDRRGEDAPRRVRVDGRLRADRHPDDQAAPLRRGLPRAQLPRARQALRRRLGPRDALRPPERSSYWTKQESRCPASPRPTSTSSLATPCGTPRPGRAATTLGALGAGPSGSGSISPTRRCIPSASAAPGRTRLR